MDEKVLKAVFVASAVVLASAVLVRLTGLEGRDRTAVMLGTTFLLSLLYRLYWVGKNG
jgi:type II secretory pathway component PulM